MLLRSLTCAAIAIAFCCLPAAAEAPYSFAATPGKLPKTVVPIDYDILLRTDITHLTFTGSEVIKVRVRSTTSKVVLDTHDVTVSAAALAGVPASIKTDNTKQLTTLTLRGPVLPGVYDVALSFAGKLGAQPSGFFHQTYSSGGVRHEMLATQMESIDARRMFPSWDEPSFRATFRLAVVVPAKFDAVSNMPAVSVSVNGGQKTVRFARTPNMSSYLVALCAGEFGYLRGTAADGVKVEVVAPKGRESQGAYALDAAEKLLVYYDDYFGTKYPLPKLDLVAIPGGFSGAMENWGAITFTDRALLFDPALGTEASRESIFTTVAHEMAHQWMGDLVTMAWWDNLWLNEGFADWMETKAADHFNPDWHAWERVNRDVEGAMATDGTTTTHPIQTPITDEAQADAAFDEIEYQKAGAFVRMTEEYLGENTFRDGIRAYLKRNAYGNTTSANLFTALSAVSHRDVAAFAKPWTATAGFPLVSVTSACTNGAQTLTLTQRRFFYEPDQKSDQLWQIPVAIANLSNPAQTTVTLLDGRSMQVPAGACGDPAIVNADATGYYRVAYDKPEFNALSTALARLSATQRVRLVADTGALATAGVVDASDYLGLVAGLKDETNLAVWENVLGTLNGLADLQVGHSGEAAFDGFRRSVLRPVFARIGWDDPSTDTSVVSLKKQLIAALSDADDPDVIAQARLRFAKLLTQPGSLSGEMLSTVLNVVGTHADEATWQQLYALEKAAKSATEKRVYLSAMWRARDPQVGARNLAMSTSGDIPPELGSTMPVIAIATVGLNGRQPKAAWAYYRDHNAKLMAGLSTFEQGLFAANLLPLFWNGAPAAELDVFAAANIPPVMALQRRNAVHQIDLQITQAERLDPIVDAWVAAHAGAAAGGAAATR